MERAALETPNSQAYLAPTINAFTAQPNTGVRQYNEMVTAAAQLVSVSISEKLLLSQGLLVGEYLLVTLHDFGIEFGIGIVMRRPG